LAFNIVYKKSVYHDLKRLDKLKAKIIMDKIEKELSENADKNLFLKGDFAGLRKFRIGNYRVVYAILKNDVVILRIRHRKDVYK